VPDEMGYKPDLTVTFHYQENLASAGFSFVVQAKNDHPQRYPKRDNTANYTFRPSQQCRYTIAFKEE